MRKKLCTLLLLTMLFAVKNLTSLAQTRISETQTFMGQNALLLRGFDSIGIHATAIGFSALQNNNYGNYNTAVGSRTLTTNSKGNYNTAIGFNALFQNSSGSFNTATGAGALQNNTGSLNTAMGFEALFANTYGARNTAIGTGALRNIVRTSDNTAIGAEVLYNNIAYNNTGLGSFALRNNTSGNGNTALGSRSLQNNTTGERNTATGDSALHWNTTGIRNVANGAGALRYNLTGSANTALGGFAMCFNLSGSDNTASGHWALGNNSTATRNTGVGKDALRFNKTGGNNTAIGFGSGGAVNPFNSTFVGALATAFDSFTNVTVIGYDAKATASNQVTLGNTLVTSIRGQVGFTTFSDGRFKRRLKEDVPGLSFITALRPVTYTLDVSGMEKTLKAMQPKMEGAGAEDMRINESSKEKIRARAEKEKIIYTGFVAQEVEAAAKELNYNFSGVDRPQGRGDFYGLRYSDFVVPLVKAVQELNTENKELRKELNELKEMMQQLLKEKGSNTTANTNLTLSGAYLYDNVPNPFHGTTIIRYHLPQSVSGAQVAIYNAKGQLLRTVRLDKGHGDGQITLSASTLPAGTYTYNLLVNGQQVDAKQMVLK